MRSVCIAKWVCACSVSGFVCFYTLFPGRFWCFRCIKDEVIPDIREYSIENAKEELGNRFNGMVAEDVSYSNPMASPEQEEAKSGVSPMRISDNNEYDSIE